MPQALGLIGLFFFNAGLTGLANLAVGLQAGLLALGGLGTTLLSVGLSLASQLFFTQKQPKPEDVQTSVRSGTASRVRHYGRVKASGPWVFADSEKGSFWKLLALQSGKAAEFEEFWVDDRLITDIAVNGQVGQGPYGGALYLFWRLGNPVETHYTILGDRFPEWDASHVGNGVASLLVSQSAMKQEKVFEAYPNGIHTSYRVVGKWSEVLNPVTEAVEWSDNAAAVILDYAKHLDGARLPAALFETPLAKAGWIAAFNRAALPIPLKGGGTEPAYRLWGSYSFDERPADVFGRMLACCDGRFVPTPDGGLTLEIGTFEVPSVTLGEDAIVGITDLSKGRDVTTTANVVRATFLSVAHDYQATDAEPWENVDDIAQRGELETSTSFNMAPSHGQARRLMKLNAYRLAPEWVGSIQCNLRGLAALGHRSVRIQYPLFGIDEVFEVSDYKFDIGEGMLLQGVTLVVHSMPQEAFEWDAATEEGNAPIAETTEVDRTVPEPEGFTFTYETESTSGTRYSVGVLEWDEPPSPSLRVEARYKRVSESSWQTVPIEVDALSARTGVLQDGVQYEAQIRHVTSTGRYSEWTDPTLKITPVANATPPLALTSISISSAQKMGNLPFSIVARSDPNLARVAAYMVPAGATLDKNVHTRITIPATAGTSFSYTAGDASRTNMLNTPDFSAVGSWSAGTGWAIGSGVATKTAGTASSVAQNLTIAAGTYRAGFTIASVTAGLVRNRLTGGTAADGTYRGAVGLSLDTLVSTGNTTYGIGANSAFAGTVDNAVLYLQTAACLAQGVWDIHAFPENASGVEGPAATVITNVVVY